jgi:hypothetical protein
MNNPWNRFVLWPSTTSSFDEDLGSSAISPVPNRGILGNFGQSAETPPIDPRPATMASNTLRLSAPPSLTYPWPISSPPQTPDPDTLRFHAAWRRLYSPPFFSPGRPPSSFPQSGVQFPASGQTFPVSALDFGSPADPGGPPWTAASDSGGWRWHAPTTSVQSNDAVNTAATTKYPNPADPRETNDGQDSPEILSDVTPDNLWFPGAEYAADGHHWFPKNNYKGQRAREKKDPIPPETQKVFDEAKTRKLRVRSINGRRHEYDVFGREYEDATEELLDDFMKANNIAKRRDLTPDHARGVIRAIEESQYPRILTYRNLIRLMQRFPLLRGGGRGME